jgi:hypothetical protein
MLICNGSDRGSNFASIQKDADLLMVFSSVNGNKPTNVRCSTTPRGESLQTIMLVGCCLESQNQLKQVVPDEKGLKTLEPYEGNFHVRFLGEGKRATAFSYPTTCYESPKNTIFLDIVRLPLGFYIPRTFEGSLLFCTLLMYLVFYFEVLKAFSVVFASDFPRL